MDKEEETWRYFKSLLTSVINGITEKWRDK